MALASASSVSPPRLVAWVLLLSHAGWTAVQYDLEVTNNGPITKDAQATIHCTLHMKNERSSSVRGQQYQFNWIYAPLTLVEKLERGANSTIVVTSPFPGVFSVSVQVAPAGCWFCPTLARGLTVLQISEFIVGNLSVTQIENSSMPEKFGSHPATATLILVSFLLHDPSHYFQTASFVYNWDFGDGTKLTTDEPSVYHNYSTPGTCVVRLEVTAEWRQQHRMKTEHSRKLVQRTGHFAAALELLEFIVGNLSVTQIENSSMPEKFGSHPATATLILVSFLLHDPSHYFQTASFVYNWDFGDGTKLTTDEPSVYHNYSTPGTCVVRLEVTAEWRQQHRMKTEHSRKLVQRTGHFAAALELLDAVQSINIIGSTEARVMENLNLSLHIKGSPPLGLCWLIKTECVPLEGDQCHLVVTNATDYSLNHVFSDAGQYCLSVRVENGVNRLQSYREIQVKPLGIHPALFVLPCLALLAVMLGLAVYVTFRSNPQQKDLVEVADFDFSPVSDKTPSGSGWSCGPLCCQMCVLCPSQESCNTVREHHHLLHPLRKPVKMYTR
nr:transmembrane protein 130 [Pogona vitticeps]